MLTAKVIIGIATVYISGDGFTGSFRADGKRFHNSQLIVAHRTLPLGTRGWMCSARTGKCVGVTVSDRGPYGAYYACSNGRRLPGTPPGRWCWRNGYRGLSPGEQYRGTFDMTRAVQKAIGHRAFDRVMFVYRRTNRLTKPRTARRVKP